MQEDEKSHIETINLKYLLLHGINKFELLYGLYFGTYTQNYLEYQKT